MRKNDLRGYSFFVILAIGLLIAGACKSSYEPETDEPSMHWTLDSFQDFVDGTFDDSGVNAYVSADGSIRLVNQWDLTGDGFVDLFLPNTHGQNERTDFFIYFGKDDWSPEQRLALPSDGGQEAAISDLNRDGRPDIILVNRFNGTMSEVDVWIYWGGSRGWSAENRTALPAQGAEAVSVGDLNGDQYPDIVVANSGLSYHVAVDSYKRSFIYWNREGRFSSKDRTELPTEHARDVVLVDHDRDGDIDVVFANEGNDVRGGGLSIFTNPGRGNFSTDNMISLPGEKCRAVAADDLDKNGWIDLVVANAFRLKGSEGGIYNIIETTYLNSFVYWGDGHGYSKDHRTELPTVNPQDIAIGDLTQNGWPDILFAQAGAGASFLYEGGPDGFSPNKRKAIPGQYDGSVQAVDLNTDGFPDLIVGPTESPESAEALRVYWGSSDGVGLSNPKSLPASNTGGIVVGDLDGDKTNDLIVVNRSDGPDASGSPGYLYAGGPNGFSPSNRIELPTANDDSYLGADLNADGYVDLFVPQTHPTIFWGAPKGFSVQNTTKVSEQFAVSGRAADFNRDGYLDLVLSEWTRGNETAHVYYGGPSGFSLAHRQALPIKSVRFHTVADLNKDGWIDILFPNFIDDKIVIYWNAPLGFDPENKSILPVRSAVSVEVADLNADGFLEVIVPNLFDKHPEPGKNRSFGGSPESDTFIFWGTAEGPVAENKTILPTVGAEDVAVADLDKNGYLDMVVTSYHAGSTRSHPSYVFWNGPDGFTSENMTLIPTNSASGTLVADFDRDGWPDIFFANHSKDGNHRTDSWLYWGGSNGFSADRRLPLPGIGPHFLTVVDIGHIYDRRDTYTYTSPMHNAGENVMVEFLTWDADTPFDSSVRFQVRAAASREALEDASWVGPSGAGSYFTQKREKATSGSISGKWFQIRIEMVSPNGANSPILRQISLRYRKN